MFKCQRNYQYLLLPTRAYVTFENELSQTVMRKIKQAPLFDVMCTFEPATEPSDINWENRNYKKPLGKKIGLLLVYFLLILMFNFSFQRWAEHSKSISISKYSDYTPCEDILQMYTIEDLEKHAADEFLYFYQNERTLRKGKIQNTLSCFCEYEESQKDDEKLKSEFVAYKTTSGKKVYACSQYFKDQKQAAWVK